MMLEPSSLPTAPLPETWVPYVLGAAGAIISVLAGCVATLWRSSAKLEAKHAEEREAWARDRTKLEGFRSDLRAEYEQKHNLAATQYADQIHEIYEGTLEHLNTARREYAGNIEGVANKLAQSMEKLGTVIDKLYDRFIAPRRGPRD